MADFEEKSNRGVTEIDVESGKVAGVYIVEIEIEIRNRAVPDPLSKKYSLIS